MSLIRAKAFDVGYGPRPTKDELEEMERLARFFVRFQENTLYWNSLQPQEMTVIPNRVVSDFIKMGKKCGWGKAFFELFRFMDSLDHQRFSDQLKQVENDFNYEMNLVGSQRVECPFRKWSPMYPGSWWEMDSGSQERKNSWWEMDSGSQEQKNSWWGK